MYIISKAKLYLSSIGAVMLAINTSISQNTQKNPYELVFGQPPRHNQEFWENIHKQSQTRSMNPDSVIDEDDILLLFNEQENPLDSSVCSLLCISCLIFFLFRP